VFKSRRLDLAAQIDESEGDTLRTSVKASHQGDERYRLRY